MRNMKLLFICTILYKLYAAYGSPEVNLKFFKNVDVNYSQLNEIHETILNFKPIILRHLNPDIPDEDLDVHDKTVKNILNTKLYSKIKHKFPTMLLKYRNYTVKKALSKINSIPEYMERKFQMKNDGMSCIKNATENFSKTAYQFFDKIKKIDCKYDIDKEFLLLNTLHTFNELLYKEELNLFYDLASKVNANVSRYIVVMAMNHFNKEHNENKRDDMEYVCLKLSICRPYPGFNDYIGNVIFELLKLSDVKLADFLIKLSIPVQYQIDFFQSFLGKSPTMKIGLKVENSIFGDIPSFRKLILALRSYLARRHKFVHNGEEETKMRNKALRILVDIIDRAFDVNGDELFAVHFDLLLKTITNLPAEREDKIQEILNIFVKHVVEIMKLNLSDEARLEIRCLVDLLSRKESKCNEVFQYLFRFGSKFVRGEDIQSQLALLL